MLDPVALEIARNRLESIAEEVGMALIRTSYSPNIKDRRDCSAGIYRADGELISQAEHIPLHLGVMPTLVRHAVQTYGADRLVPGDILITNNPYLGGSHLPDTCLITPVFDGGRIVALIANMAHHVDIGGITPGSMATHATEIFQEGVRIPPVRLFAAGEEQEVFAVLMTNVRTPEKTRGDLLAQVAANRLGERRVTELLAEWGVERFDVATRELIDYAERRTRAALAALPDGEGDFVDHLDHDGVRPARLEISARVVKRGDEITVDLTATADAAEGAVNCSYAVAESCVAYVVKMLADPTLPSNAGLMRPVRVVTRPGSLVDARFPSPVAHGNIQTAQRIVDAVLGACERFLPGRVPAASCGSMSIVTIGGIDPRTGEYFSYVETYGGGQGALPTQDGADATHTHMTNTRNTPSEVIEREYPLRVERYEIARGTGGHGRFRGGDGLVRELTLTRGTATVVAGTARVDAGPWGLEGGGPGDPARVWTSRDGDTVELPAMSRLDVVPGQRVGIRTAGGGAYGPSEEDAG
jgi:N-methylhydantoinase B